MSIPPIKKPEETQNLIPTDRHSIQELYEPLHFPHMVEEEIQSCLNEREAIVSQFLPEVQELAHSFLRDHAIVEALIFQTRNRASLANPKDLSKEELVENRRIEDELNEKLQDLKNRYRAHGFEYMFIYAAAIEPRKHELEIKFYIEKSKVCFINRLAYLEEVKQFVEQNEIKILNEFYPQYLDLGIDPKTITFNVELVEGETHNHGKIPAFIHFSMNGNQLFKIVFKPRNATLDAAVIETFKKINEIDKVCKSFDTFLPEYKIINFDNRSIWEYIEGDDIKLERSVGDFIGRKPNNSRWQTARLTLNRMDAILTRMGISDLHKENIKVRNLAGEDVKFFPIDLENRYIGAPTQLGGRPKEVNLSPQEDALIRDIFEPLAVDAPFRYIPLGTQLMAGLIGDFKLNDDLFRRLMNQFQLDRYLVEIQPNQLKRLLLRSAINHDVPYFSERGGILYYGLPDEWNIIARKEV
jgi:hypothetical protein